jgi:hypothetical protein
MDDSVIFLLVMVVAGVLVSVLFAVRRGKGSQPSAQPVKQSGWEVGRRVNEMTDEPIEWLSVMSENGSEILQLARENDAWEMNFTSAAGLRDGNFLFRFDTEPPIAVSWKKFAFARRAVVSEGDITLLVTKLSNATTLKIQFTTTGERLTVGRFDIRGFETAAARIWPLGILPSKSSPGGDL